MKLILPKAFKKVTENTVNVGYKLFQNEMIKDLVSTLNDNHLSLTAKCEDNNCNIEINDSDITRYHCSCYVGTHYTNVICKHIVAVIYEYNWRHQAKIDKLFGISLKKYLNKQYTENTNVEFFLDVFASNQTIMDLEINSVTKDNSSSKNFNVYSGYIDKPTVNKIIELVKKIVDDNHQDNQSLLTLLKKLEKFKALFDDVADDFLRVNSYLLAYLKHQDETLREMVKLYIDKNSFLKTLNLTQMKK